MFDLRFLLMMAAFMAAFTMLIFAFSGPSGEKALNKRLSAVRDRHSPNANSALEVQMRRAIDMRRQENSGSLAARLIPNPQNLAKRLAMTGKSWTVAQYAYAVVGIFIIVWLLLLTRGFAPLFAMFVGLFAGLAIPHMIVGRLIRKRVTQFTVNFPDALELLVRGLRSGLPISETLGVVASEIPGPVGEEFRAITERIKIGKTMEAALQDTADRLGTPEFQFFVITLAIQRETGGNLAETLYNLADVLRKRAQMKLKIKAMSSEAKASAYIIGVLPFLVFGLITYINFQYMSPFFTGDPNGLFGLSLMQVVGIGGLFWMGTGAFIMSRMISFEI